MAKILLVDDEAHVLNSLARVLGQNYDVYTAASGAEGLRVLDDQGPFAVIISDYRMPNMSGAEFLQEARRRCRAIRLMLTGYPELRVAEEAIEKGDVFLFLAKPCVGPELEEAVRTAIDEYIRRESRRGTPGYA